MGFVEECGSQFEQEHIVRRVKKQGCSVSLRNLPRTHIMIDLDKGGLPIDVNRRICDYLMFAEERKRAIVAVIELKKGKLRTSKVVDQLRGGASLAEKYLSPKERVRFRAIAVTGRVHKIQNEELKDRKNFVRFRQSVAPVRLIACGSELSRELG